MPEPDTMQHEVETNVRVPVTVENLPHRKYSLEERMLTHEVPGLSVAVIEDGRLSWARGYGVAESGKAARVTPATRFSAASVSKPVTALVVLSLVKRGQIDLDAPANGYLKRWQLPEDSFTRTTPVTPRMLLSHTAGLTNGNGFPGYKAGEKVPTLIEILNASAPKVNSKPVAVGTLPGAHFAYSGGGYQVLQTMIEDITGRPFEDFAMTTVLAPLGMENSSFEAPARDESPTRAASAHNRHQVVPGRWHTYPEKAAAGLWTTPLDLAKLILAAYGCANGNPTSSLTPILGTALCQEMLTMVEWPRLDGGTRKMGLGFQVREYGDGFEFHHGGSNEGVKCNFRGLTSGGTLNGTVIMTNSSEGHLVIDELEHTIDDVYGWRTHTPVIRTQADVPWDTLRERVGTRYHRGTDFLTVVEQDGHLALVHSRDEPPQPKPIFPESENRFFDLDGGLFEFSNARLLWLMQGGKRTLEFFKR